jgi:proton-translocating NADH-quinone oxidoreductase chain M
MCTYLNRILLLNLLFPIIGIAVILLIKSDQRKVIKLIALNASSFSFIGFLYLWINFNKSIIKFQFIYKSTPILLFNFNIMLGVDGVSLLFLVLTTLLIPVCFVISWYSVKYFIKEYLITFLILDFLLIGTFSSLDLLLFYVLFESILIPMFLIIGIWGSRERKILANYYLFMYTIFGSLLLLVAIIYIFDQIGTADYTVLLVFSFSDFEQLILWFLLFMSFSSKIPMLPLHLWLPEAHVEAPTAGSVILAGILLKLGVYGFIRFSITLFPIASFYFTPLIYSLAIIGIIYGSLTAIRQSDFKKIIAYTSIAHMNLVILGIFSYNIIGLQGAVYQSINHGFISSGLFILIGSIYDRYRTRIINYYSGLASVMPIFTFIFLLFNIANIGFPGTGSFLGELFIFIGLFKVNSILTLFSALSLILSALYTLWLFNRISFGNLKVQYLVGFIDLNVKEFITIIPLILGSTVSGLYSNILLTPITYNMNYLIELTYI